jgi:hypothetical protein
MDHDTIADSEMRGFGFIVSRGFKGENSTQASKDRLPGTPVLGHRDF